MARRCHRHDPAPPVPDEMHAAALVFQPVADGSADLCFDRRQRLPPVVVEGVDLVERVERIDQRPVDGRDDAVGLHLRLREGEAAQATGRKRLVVDPHASGSIPQVRAEYVGHEDDERFHRRVVHGLRSSSRKWTAGSPSVT